MGSYLGSSILLYYNEIISETIGDPALLLSIGGFFSEDAALVVLFLLPPLIRVMKV